MSQERKVALDTDRPDPMQAWFAEEALKAIGEQGLAGLTFDQTAELMCRRFVECLHYPLVWIGTKESSGAIKVRAFGGTLGHVVENYQELWKGRSEAQGVAARAIQHNAIQEYHECEIVKLGHEGEIRQHGVQAGLAIPLTFRNRVLGVLNVFGISQQTFGQGVLPKLKGFAGQLSLGLYLAREYAYLRIQETAVNSAGQAVCIANSDGCIEWVNEAYCQLTGYQAEEVLGTLIPSFPTAETRRPIPHLKPLNRSSQFWRKELINTHKDGHVYTVEQILSPHLDERGNLLYVVSVLRDITDQKHVEAQILHRALHDPLTGLPNRVMFHDRLTQALAWARRQGRLVSVLFLDLDGFKQINDEWGHDTGDKILQAVALRLKDCIRATDTIARLSGDEYSIILQDFRQVGDVHRVAQKILDRLEQPIFIEGQTLFSKTSMGIAVYPFDGAAPDALLQRADGAMYKAKREGGQCCRFASEELISQLASPSEGQIRRTPH